MKDTPSVTQVQRRRLPAYARELRERILAGQRPVAGGGTVVLAVGWRQSKLFPTAVCDRAVDVERWELGWLRGLGVLVEYQPGDEAYAQRLAERVREFCRDVYALEVSAELWQ